MNLFSYWFVIDYDYKIKDDVRLFFLRKSGKKIKYSYIFYVTLLIYFEII
jgi:hypothetical protein